MSKINGLLITGKYLDQPRLVGKISSATPKLLVGGGVLYALKESKKHNDKHPKKNFFNKRFLKSLIVLSATIGSALVATRGIGSIKLGSKTIFKGIDGLSEKIDLSALAKENSELINNFLSKNKTDKKTAEILNKAKTNTLKRSEIKEIFNKLYHDKNGKEFLNKLIPNPENIDSKHIFSEIKRLSLMGLIPVLGGITGGVLADKLTEKDWKARIPNKIKEGSYQYFANIFLCNIGAGVALAMLEKANIKSKAARAVGMVTGILLMGVIFGSAFANFIGRTCIDPLFKNHHMHGHGHGHGPVSHHYHKAVEGVNHKGLFSERTPEALDIGLHLDDVATVAVLSGLKWIEPMLPVFYSISGYRAGIGYRN